MPSQFARRTCVLYLRQLKKRTPGRKIESSRILPFYPVILAVLLSWLIVAVNVPDPEEAIAEIRKNVNTQFDPAVAEIFLNLMERGHLTSISGFFKGAAVGIRP